MDTNYQPRSSNSNTAGIPAVSARKVQLRRRERGYARIAATYNVFDDNGVCIAADLPMVTERTNISFGGNRYSVPALPSARTPEASSALSTDPLVLRFIAACDAVSALPIPSDDASEGWRVARDKLMSIVGTSRRDATRRIRRTRLVAAGLYIPHDVVETPPILTVGRKVTHTFTRG